MTVPTGVAVFSGDYAIRSYGERGFNIVHGSEFGTGVTRPWKPLGCAGTFR